MQRAWTLGVVTVVLLSGCAGKQPKGPDGGEGAEDEPSSADPDASLTDVQAPTTLHLDLAASGLPEHSVMGYQIKALDAAAVNVTIDLVYHDYAVRDGCILLGAHTSVDNPEAVQGASVIVWRNEFGGTRNRINAAGTGQDTPELATIDLGARHTLTRQFDVELASGETLWVELGATSIDMVEQGNATIDATSKGNVEVVPRAQGPLACGVSYESVPSTGGVFSSSGQSGTVAASRSIATTVGSAAVFSSDKWSTIENVTISFVDRKVVVGHTTSVNDDPRSLVLSEATAGVVSIDAVVSAEAHPSTVHWLLGDLTLGVPELVFALNG